METGIRCEELERVIFGEDGEKYFPIGKQLPLTKREELLIFLKNNLDFLLGVLIRHREWIPSSYVIISMLI